MQMVDLHYLERKNFPSDKELLKKCYETDGCKECKNPSGSIPLRDDVSVHPHDEAHKGLLSGLKAVNWKKKKYVDPNPYPDPDPVPAPEPEPNPAPDVGTHVEPPVDEDYGESTYVPPIDFDSDKTVYGQGLSDGTVVGGYGADFDDDQTVRIARNLAILLHPAEQKAYKLKSPKITIGRSQIRCDVAIEGNDSISKVHAIIRQTKQKCYIEDANSSNGTYINGEQIEPGKQIPLDNPAIFQLNDETLILLSGLIARKFDKKNYISLLINDEGTAARIMDTDTLALNRNNKWPDGTLADPKVHRAGHALLSKREDGVYLVDESPEKGNGTHLNGSRLRHGAEKRLTSGDRIRLGDTTLEFISIEIPS